MRDHLLPAIPSEDRTADGETVLLEWTVHLLRRDPARARVVGVVMLLSSLLGVALFHSALFLFLGPLLIFSATAEYLLPVRYRLTDRRACAAYGAARLEIAWDRVKRRDLGAEAMKLSPFAHRNRLDNFRGVVLRFAEAGEVGDRDAVLRVVEERLDACRSELRSTVAASVEGAAT